MGAVTSVLPRSNQQNRTLFSGKSGRRRSRPREAANLKSNAVHPRDRVITWFCVATAEANTREATEAVERSNKTAPAHVTTLLRRNAYGWSHNAISSRFNPSPPHATNITTAAAAAAAVLKL